MGPFNAMVEELANWVRRYGSFDRCRWRPPGPLPTLCKSDTGFQFPATTLDFLSIPTPSRRKNAISMLFTYSNTFAAFGRLGSRDFDRRGFTLGHLSSF